MGGHYSAEPKVPRDFSYFLLCFSHDSILFTFACDEVVEIVRRAAQECWTKGIQAEGSNLKNGCYSIKLFGTPFSQCGTSESALQTKLLCCKLLADLRAHGWILITSSDLSRKSIFSTLLFQKNAMENEPKLIMCVSVSSFETLQLINAPEQVKMIFKNVIFRGYPLGIEEERESDYNYEITLKGYRWSSDISQNSADARKLLLDMFRSFDDVGYHFYGTANLKGTANCIFFLYDQLYNRGEHSYIMISLNRSNSMMLIDCPVGIVKSTRSLINRYWRRGLQEQRDLQNNVLEFILTGKPRWTDDDDAVCSNLLITMILQDFLSIGWCLAASLEISHNLNDNSVFVFKSYQPMSLPHFCLSLSQYDKLRLINAPKNVIELVRQAVVEGWPLGIKVDGDYLGSHQFTLNGDACGDEWSSARCIMFFVLRTFMENGWRIIGSVDISTKYYRYLRNHSQYPLDVHTWFFAYTDNTKAVTLPVPPPSSKD